MSNLFLRQMIRQSIIILFFLFSSRVFAQERTKTVGVQIKSFIASDFFDTGGSKKNIRNVSIEQSPGYGFSAGMTIRQGFTKRFSFETGINYVKRKPGFKILDDSLKQTFERDLTTISYEVPALAMVFIRISEKIHMNTAAGFSFDLYPSGYLVGDNVFYLDIFKRSWIGAGLLANLGFELRTEKKGFIYLGTSYHRPFADPYLGSLYYKNGGTDLTENIKVSGNYFAIDIRYYFHEDPIPFKRKKKKE